MKHDTTKYEHVEISEDSEDPEDSTVRPFQTSRSSSQKSCCCSCRSFWKLLVILISNFVSFRVGSYTSRFKRTYDYNLHCDSLSYGFVNTDHGKALSQELLRLSSSEGPVSALLYMKQQMQDDRQINDSCHEVLHTLGRTVWSEDRVEGLSFREGFLEITNDFIGTEHEELLRLCSAGYFHGMIESGLNGLVSQVDKEAETDTAAAPILEEEVVWLEETICNALKIQEGEEEGSLSNRWECMHGIGHGVLEQRRGTYRTFELKESLKICARTANVGTCSNGIWMEYWDHIGMTAGMDLDNPKENPLSICLDESLESYDSNSCKLFAPRAYLLHHPKNYVGAMISFCARASYDPICIVGVGYQVAKQNKESFVPLEQTCLLAPTIHERFQCFQGGINHALGFRHEEGNARLPPTLCDGLEYFQSVCRSFESSEEVSVDELPAEEGNMAGP